MRSHKRTAQQFHHPNPLQQSCTARPSLFTSFHSLTSPSSPSFQPHNHRTSSVSFSQAKLDEQWCKFKARCLKSSKQSFRSQDQPLLIHQSSKQNELTLNRKIVIYREEKLQPESQWVEDIDNKPNSQQFQYLPPNTMINSLATNEDDKENINYYGQERNEEGMQQGECFCCVEGCQRCAGDYIPQTTPISFIKRCSTIEQVSEPSNTTMNAFLYEAGHKETGWIWKQDCIANYTRGKNKLK